MHNALPVRQAYPPWTRSHYRSTEVSLFREHLLLADQLVKAAKSGDNAGAAEAERKWYANADEIAAFLGSINPYWSQADWQRMLHEHLRLTKQEAVYRLSGQYAEDIATFDVIEQQTLEMADRMTNGIVRQFSHP